MKHNLVTLIGVVAIVAGIVFVRGAFEQTPRTDADEKAAEAAEEQLEEAEEISEEAAANETAAAETGESTGDSASAESSAPASLPEVESGSADVQAAMEQFEAVDEWPEAAPDVYRVKFETSTGPYVIEVHKEWAPIGAERFYELCKTGYYNDARYFRVLPDFVAQFGLAADPKLTAQYRTRNLKDEPVRASNTRGKVTFAKSSRPNTRSAQVFINFADNSKLDNLGFSPFGEVIAGMESVDAITTEYGQRPDQGRINAEGNEYLKKEFPNLDYIKRVTLVK